MTFLLKQRNTISPMCDVFQTNESERYFHTHYFWRLSIYHEHMYASINFLLHTIDRRRRRRIDQWERRFFVNGLLIIYESIEKNMHVERMFEFCMSWFITTNLSNNTGCMRTKKHQQVKERNKKKCATFSRTIELSYPNNNLDNKSMLVVPVIRSHTSRSVRIEIFQ